MIITNKTMCEKLYRVLQARLMGKNEWSISGLHVETINEVTYAVAMDGNRLHYDVIIDIPDGNYSVPVCKRNQIVLEPTDWTFPNWRNIVPKSFSHMVEWGYSKDNLRSLFIFYQATECPVNPKFLTDLGYGEYTVFWTNAKTAMAIREGSFVAIIMPLTLRDDDRPKVQDGTFNIKS